MSKFLDDLKKAADAGEFNSEAAKKIVEIDKLVDNPRTSHALSFAYEQASKNGEIKTFTEEELPIINSEYEKKMLEIKEKDLALQELATLKEIDETLMLSIGDMNDFILTLEETFDKAKPVNLELFQEIEKIKSKYSQIIL